MVRFWRGTITQPFAIKLFPGITRVHPQFISRTVMVKDNDVETAFMVLNRLMEKEGLLSIIRRTTRYIVPCKQREQASRDVARALFNEDMSYKTKFILRKNRTDPFPGQMTT
uniref:28S ribosomal protein S21, mitochondrial n=1 Tax=Syphacia muris TaxID=451379 RepID=A0A0N5AWV3_9BILA